MRASRHYSNPLKLYFVSSSLLLSVLFISSSIANADTADGCFQDIDTTIRNQEAKCQILLKDAIDQYIEDNYGIGEFFDKHLSAVEKLATEVGIGVAANQAAKYLEQHAPKTVTAVVAFAGILPVGIISATSICGNAVKDSIANEQSIKHYIENELSKKPELKIKHCREIISCSKEKYLDELNKSKSSPCLNLLVDKIGKVFDDKKTIFYHPRNEAYDHKWDHYCGKKGCLGLLYADTDSSHLPKSLTLVYKPRKSQNIRNIKSASLRITATLADIAVGTKPSPGPYCLDVSLNGTIINRFNLDGLENGIPFDPFHSRPGLGFTNFKPIKMLIEERYLEKINSEQNYITISGGSDCANTWLAIRSSVLFVKRR